MSSEFSFEFRNCSSGLAYCAQFLFLDSHRTAFRASTKGLLDGLYGGRGGAFLADDAGLDSLTMNDCWNECYPSKSKQEVATTRARGSRLPEGERSQKFWPVPDWRDMLIQILLHCDTTTALLKYECNPVAPTNIASLGPLSFSFHSIILPAHRSVRPCVSYAFCPHRHCLTVNETPQ